MTTALVMVQMNVVESDAPEPSDAVTVTEQLHAVVGVPEMVPVAGSTVRPAGRPVALKEIATIEEVSMVGTGRGLIAVPDGVDWSPGPVMVTVLMMVQLNDVESEKPDPSVATTTTGKTPPVVGVPVIDPVVGSMDSPAGSPVADQVSAAPDCVSVAELVSAVIAVPDGADVSDWGVTATVLVTVQANEAVPEKPAPSVATMVTEHEHGAVGVPVTVPVDELMERPAGSPVADQVRVAPDWESVAELDSAAMAVPVTALWLPGLATVTVLVTVQAKVAVPD
jgi:hypothetical protein